MNNTKRLATIDTLLASVPTFECRAGCADCCGPVIMTRLEMERICARTGKTTKELDFTTVMMSDTLKCPLLDSSNRCSVYDIRPAICRVFGASQDPHLACPHGCKPEKPLTQKETSDTVEKVAVLGHGFPANAHCLVSELKKRPLAHH